MINKFTPLGEQPKHIEFHLRGKIIRSVNVELGKIGDDLDVDNDDIAISADWMHVKEVLFHKLFRLQAVSYRLKLVYETGQIGSFYGRCTLAGAERQIFLNCTLSPPTHFRRVS